MWLYRHNAVKCCFHSAVKHAIQDTGGILPHAPRCNIRLKNYTEKLFFKECPSSKTSAWQGPIQMLKSILRWAFSLVGHLLDCEVLSFSKENVTTYHSGRIVVKKSDRHRSSKPFPCGFLWLNIAKFFTPLKNWNKAEIKLYSKIVFSSLRNLECENVVLVKAWTKHIRVKI